MIARLLALLATLVLMVACAGGPTTTNQSFETAYSGVEAYTTLAIGAKKRGRISDDQLRKAIANAEKAVVKLDFARQALTACAGKVPCDPYVELMKQFQEMMFAYERELREQEAAK